MCNDFSNFMTDQNPTPSSGSNYYGLFAKVAGWISVATFTMAFINKLANKEWLFSPSDLFQASLYLVLFAIFAAMAAITQH
jgi:hypothetical protein